MKRLFLLCAILMAVVTNECYSQSGMSQKQGERAKKEAMVKIYIERLITDTTYMIHISQGGVSASNTSLGLPGISSYEGYFVKLNRSKFSAYLPFAGARTGSSLTGGGIDVDTDKYEMSVEQNKKGTAWNIHIKCSSTQGDSETFNFNIDITTKGSVSINVTSSARESVNYMGTIRELPKNK